MEVSDGKLIGYGWLVKCGPRQNRKKTKNKKTNRKTKTKMDMWKIWAMIGPVWCDVPIGQTSVRAPSACQCGSFARQGNVRQSETLLEKVPSQSRPGRAGPSWGRQALDCFLLAAAALRVGCGRVRAGTYSQRRVLRLLTLLAVSKVGL